jgi:hypothetical protein
MRVVIASLSGLIVLSPLAQAQKAPVKDTEEVICVSGPRWHPTFRESTEIETVPVPASYRAMFESTEPCVKWATDLGGIVDWHLRFGSAASVSVALGYIERDKRRLIPAPDAYLPLLREAFYAAVSDLKRAAALKQPPGLSYSVSYKFMQQSKPVTRLNQLIRAREDYVFLALQYLRAAEEFTAPTLLAKAEPYISTADAAAGFLTPLESKPPVQGQLYFNLHRFKTDDLRARAALLRARISGSEADLDQADAILKAHERSTDKMLALLVYSGGDDFCDITDGASGSETIEASCRAEDDIEQRLSNLVINRAEYDAIFAGMKGAEPAIAWPSWTTLAERLLAFEALPDRGRCCGRSASEDRLRLLMTRADYGSRLIATMSATAGPEDEREERQRVWHDTLALLVQAERLAPPYAAPARFTRIAERWLKTWEAGPALFADYRDYRNPMRDPEKQRFAAYLTVSAESLAR